MAAGAGGPAEVWPLLGRQTEIDMFNRTLGRSKQGSIVLVGPPGVGKARLAFEALVIAKEHGRVCVQAVASRAAATIPLGALAPLRLEFYEGAFAGDNPVRFQFELPSLPAPG